VEHGRLLVWRWHPNAVDPKQDYSAEPMTQVALKLDDAAVGTWLTVEESGFDEIPVSRRSEAFHNNERGWTMQLESIKQYLANAA
jgi:hypothetical protein